MLNADIINKIMGVQPKKPKSRKSKSKPSDKAINTIYHCIVDNGKISAQDLRRLSGFGSSTVSVVVALLKSEGKITRDHNKGYGRWAHFSAAEVSNA